jgi:hypothetical protein
MGMSTPYGGGSNGMRGWPPHVIQYRVYRTVFRRWYIDKYVDSLNRGPVIHSFSKDRVTAKAVELQLLGENVVFENE